MLLLSVMHPDIFDFVKIKKDRTKVTGANVSVILTDEFLKASNIDSDFYCRFPIDSDIAWKNATIDTNTYNKLIEHPDHKGVFVMRIKAKELFDLIIEMAWENAEPGLAFIDRIINYSPDGVYEQFKARSSNPCVTGDTKVLTEDGYERIDFIVDTPTIIWNGFNWSNVIPKVTGTNQKIFEVILSDGRILNCTEYHKWILNDDSRVETINLKAGDKLQKHEFPIIKGGIVVNKNEAYTQGFISGDGQDGYNHLWLYEPKFVCQDRLDGNTTSIFVTNSGIKRSRFKLNRRYNDKNYVPFEWSEECRIEWVAGLLDSDGTELKEGGSQISSVDREFLKNVQDLLSTLGVNSKVVFGKDSVVRSMPNGNGGYKDYECKQCWRICIGSKQMQYLKSLGLECSRMTFNKSPNRDASQFTKVISVNYIGIADKVYCFNEPINHSGIFNGIMTANCGEIWMGDYDSCRLMALNLFSIVLDPFTPDARIDYNKLYEISYTQQRLADDLVDLELEHIQAIIDKIKVDPEPKEVKRTELELWQNVYNVAKAGRRTGCGFTSLADMLAAIGLKYDSNEALQVVDLVMKTKMTAELDCTIDLSILRGSFEGWDAKKEYPYPYGKETNGNDFYAFLFDEFLEQVERMIKYGRRNVSFSTVAPTGSVSILTQTSSGIEPLFLPWYTRKKKINPGEEGARVDFKDPKGDCWQEFAVLHPKFKDWFIINLINRGVSKNASEIRVAALEKWELEALFKESPWYKSCANDISWENRIKLQSIVQKYITHSISSTINLPKDISKDVVANIYLEAWKQGLKGVTIYRDGCRDGVLTSSSSRASKFSYKDAVKRPKVLSGEGSLVTIKGEEYMVIIGLLDDNPYEVFASVNKWNVPKCFACDIIKEGKGKYIFDIRDILRIEDFNHEVTDEQATITRLLSTSMRHGTDVKHICHQLGKTHGNIVSFSKAIMRVLKKYIPNGEEVVGQSCPNCAEKLVLEEGCKKCYSCGYSAC